MSNKIQISKPLNYLLKHIAKTDGGKNKKEIDSAKGYQQLCDILSGNLKPGDYEITQTDKAYVNALKVQYEEKYIPKEMIQNNMLNPNTKDGKMNIVPMIPFLFNNPNYKNDDNLPPGTEIYQQPDVNYQDI